MKNSEVIVIDSEYSAEEKAADIQITSADRIHIEKNKNLQKLETRIHIKSKMRKDSQLLKRTLSNFRSEMERKNELQNSFLKQLVIHSKKLIQFYRKKVISRKSLKIKEQWALKQEMLEADPLYNYLKAQDNKYSFSKPQKQGEQKQESGDLGTKQECEDILEISEEEFHGFQYVRDLYEPNLGDIIDFFEEIYDISILELLESESTMNLMFNRILKQSLEKQQFERVLQEAIGHVKALIKKQRRPVNNQQPREDSLMQKIHRIFPKRVKSEKRIQQQIAL